MNWYYVEQGQQMGPVTEEQLAPLFKAGKINGDTLVWCEGRADWSPYRETLQGSPLAQTMPTGAGTPPVAGVTAGEVVCAECGKVFPITETIRHGNVYVCAGCKPVFLQKLSEGAQVSTGQLNYARVLTRFAAAILDGVILFAVNFPIGYLIGLAFAAVSQGRSGAMLVLPFVANAIGICIGLAYEVILIGKYGATLGKMACKIKVVTADGGKVGYGRALGRYFAKMLSGCTLMIGYIIAIFDDQKRALHDHICNTRVVVNDR